MEIQEADEPEELEGPTFLTVAIAVNGSRNSKHAVKWALDKFAPEGRIFFRLLHVRSKITMIPTPMGNYLPISNVREDVASAYKKEVEWQANSLLLPYKKMCAKRQVEAEAVIIEADDVADAISGEISKFTITKLVIGSSSRSIFTRKLKGSKMSSKISGCTPSFCTVYVVSKGKLSSVRSATSGVVEEISNDANSSSSASCNFSSFSPSTCSERTGTDGMTSVSLHHSPLPHQRNQAIANINNIFANKRHTSYDNLGMYTDEGSMSSSSTRSEIQRGNSMISSYKSFESDNFLLNSNVVSTSENRLDSPLPQDPVDINFELQRLRVELRHFQKLHEVAEDESIDATHRIHELGIRRIEEEDKLKEIKLREERVKWLAKKEREERQAAERESERVKVCAERELAQRKYPEKSAARDLVEKQILEKSHEGSSEQCKRYTWEEIQSATSMFSNALMIGKGSNGTVYKGNFQHTIAAVKILHSNEGRGMKQFNQELEILGRIRHPHLLLLLGACPEHGCLVYEYMENGSLDDRLQCKNDTPPLPWFYRYRIVYEVASALLFLHSSNPEPIIHRDLKPANILLDHNFVSKIGDVGLSTLLPAVNCTISTANKDTAPVGTFFYIDPEYQRSGLVSPKSDTYALGMVILQLLTAKPPMGLAHTVERALENRHITEILDPKAGDWPFEETLELLRLGLSCAELRGKDRPNLKEQVLPIVERLKEIAMNTQDTSVHVPSAPPNHFICPILQELMEDPYVASDGYTYDRRAIEMWLTMNDKSPMTNLRLPNKTLIPNHSLRSAIIEWKSREN